MRIEKDVYGLKQAGIIVNQELVKHMAPFRYHPVKHTPGLWVYNSRKNFSVLWLIIYVSNIALQRMLAIF